MGSLTSGSGRYSPQDNKVLSPLSPRCQDSLVPRGSSLPPRSFPLPEVVTQLVGRSRIHSPAGNLLKDQGIALVPSMWELPGWWGVLPLTQVPSSSPHFPQPPVKGDHANQPFLSGSFQPHPTCSPRVMSGSTSPEGTWKFLAPKCGVFEQGVSVGGFYPF